ncbi:MAG: aminoacyl-tRNA hydrolase, partial [bacterium]
NVGFLSLDRVSERFNIPIKKSSNREATGRGRFGNEDVILLKPLGYMNRSGDVVVPLVLRENVDGSRVLVIIDDMDLPLGTVRYRVKGGSAGHRGMESIVNRLGHSDFGRIRLGIGRPENRKDSSSYVLSEFTGDEHTIMEKMFDATTDLVEKLINEGTLDPITLNLSNAEEEL